MISASTLYDYLQCPHRVWRDIYGPQEEKIKETNDFVKLLWEKGIHHEKNIVSQLGDFVDLSEGTYEERYRRTLIEINNGTELIYQGVLMAKDLIGIPDLLRKNQDGQYVPIDIKSGKAFEGSEGYEEDEGKPKKHYAVQLCLYNDLLGMHNLPRTGEGIIIDNSSREVVYHLSEPIHKDATQSWNTFYNSLKNEVALLQENKFQNDPALAGVCKLCPWYYSCSQWVMKNNDLTRIFYIGRSVRDTLKEDLKIETTYNLLTIDIEKALKKKKNVRGFLSGIGEAKLKQAVQRAKVLLNIKKPVAYNKIKFPKVKYELYLDIEDDPTQDFVYLHGIYLKDSAEENFVYFMANENNNDSEKIAFKNLMDYIISFNDGEYAVYYYSAHEKTNYKALLKKYPDVIAAETVEALFSSPNFIDLYSVVIKNTDWPLPSYSVKEIARYLGFEWRDKSPSGALSIQWFNEYINTKDETIKKRILEYNEDDCKAMLVLKNALEKMKPDKNK